MNTTWIGDFRLSSLERYYNASLEETDDKKESDTKEVIVTPAQVTARYWIGDSRFHGIELLKIHSAIDTFIAKDSQGYDWLVSTAIPSLATKLKNVAGEVVILGLGVNDLGHINSYINKYRELINKYPNVKFIVTSVTPVNEDKSKYVKNSNIEEFNKKLLNAFGNNYLDIYGKIKSQVTSEPSATDKEGIHYSESIKKTIYNMIVTDISSTLGYGYYDDSNESTFIIESDAEYSWLENEISDILPQLYLGPSNIVIMLGFIDCVNSCVWECFDVEKIASDYAKTINKLTKDYSDANFYICSVNPINSNFPFSPYDISGIIPKKILNSKIKKFNLTLKKNLKDSGALFINSYSYLISSGFNTRDGIYFTQDTCEDLQNFILGHFKGIAGVMSGGRITPRMALPELDDDSYIYWINERFTFDGEKGKNKCISRNPETGLVLPNCTGYAWGRFMEILGSTPKLSTGNAGTWYDNTSDGYSRGSIPQVGAVICWGGGSSGAGHVAIVEKVNGDGSILISNSDYSGRMFYTATVYKSSNYSISSSHKFQGFIYNPAVSGQLLSNTPTTNPDSSDSEISTVDDIPSTNDNNPADTTVGLNTITKADVIAIPGKFLNESQMQINARYIWNYLGSRGWTLNAVAGMLGNMEHESTINPAIREVGNSKSGFGLAQWTPPGGKGTSAFEDWCKQENREKADIDTQLDRIIYEKDNGLQYIKKHYKYTFNEFAISMDDPYTLACAWAFDYERPRDSFKGTAAQKEALRKKRGTAAEKWYAFLSPYSPGIQCTERFIADNFKISEATPTTAMASFIVRNGKEYSYFLYKGTEKIDEKKSISVESDEPELMIVKIECKKLIPNTSYKLLLEVTSAIGGDTKELEVKFKTPQDYPDSIEEITLTPNLTNGYKDFNNTFCLNIKKPKELGYWKKNLKGYNISLIINGRTRKFKTINSVSNMSLKSFDISKEFDYNCKADDTVQIGVRTWVTDNNGKRVYDSPSATTSKPICFLNKPVSAFLNLKKLT